MEAPHVNGPPEEYQPPNPELVIDMLRMAITTAHNDDYSKPQTLMRSRHVYRVEAMRLAIECIIALRDL